MRTQEDQISELVETFTATGCRRDAAQEILSEAIFEAERRAEQRVGAQLSTQIEQQEETIKALQVDLSDALAQIDCLTF